MKFPATSLKLVDVLCDRSTPVYGCDADSRWTPVPPEGVPLIEVNVAAALVPTKLPMILLALAVAPYNWIWSSALYTERPRRTLLAETIRMASKVPRAVLVPLP